MQRESKRPRRRLDVSKERCSNYTSDKCQVARDEGRETERKTKRDMERETDRETEREIERETEREIKRDVERDVERVISRKILSISDAMNGFVLEQTRGSNI